jgi:hypothetical protein
VIARRILYATLAVLGLALYLWPALSAPVVLWSDSALDLGWARHGEGIVTPVVSPHHPPKPGFILFLRAVLAVGPGAGTERRVVVAQSILLWLAIAGTALFVGRRVGPRTGLLLYVVLVLLLRLRDASSAVMSEALTAAILLPLVAVLLEPPARAWTAALLGVAAAALFLVRPNAGAVALVAAAASLELAGRGRRVAPLVLGFLLLWAPVWWTTSVAGDPFRGMSPAFITGSHDYAWVPEPERPAPEPPPAVQVRSALERWNATLAEASGDRGRQLAWRALHGLLGTDYYDARWSPLYSRADFLSRVATPPVTLASIAVLLAVSFRGRARIPKILGLLLAVLLVAQSLVLGALPRLALPFLPALILCGVAALPGLDGVSRRFAAALILVALAGAVAWQRQVLDWEWGRIEAPGLRFVQPIPRGALPATAPATLHIRVAPLVVPTTVELEVLGPDGARLAAESPVHWGDSPYLTIPLPEALLAANRRGPVEIALVSRGTFDAVHFLVFPVIPLPWGEPARRDGSAELSPSTGIPAGSVDWWAHAGLR